MGLRVGVNGAGGRMGQRVVALTMMDSELTLAAALDIPTVTGAQLLIGLCLGKSSQRS